MLLAPARPGGSAQVIDSILWMSHSQKCCVFFSRSLIFNDTIVIKLQVFKLWNCKRRKCRICVANRLHLLLQFKLLSGYFFSHGYNCKKNKYIYPQVLSLLFFFLILPHVWKELGIRKMLINMCMGSFYFHIFPTLQKKHNKSLQ